MKRENVFELYLHGIITKQEMFCVLREYNFEPPDEFNEEYQKWVECLGQNPVTFCISA